MNRVPCQRSFTVGVIDQFTEEILQVGTEVGDVPHLIHETNDLPALIWAHPDIPSDVAYLDVGFNGCADGVDTVGDPGQSLTTNCREATTYPPRPDSQNMLISATFPSV